MDFIVIICTQISSYKYRSEWTSIKTSIVPIRSDLMWSQCKCFCVWKNPEVVLCAFFCPEFRTIGELGTIGENNRCFWACEWSRHPITDFLQPNHEITRAAPCLLLFLNDDMPCIHFSFFFSSFFLRNRSKVRNGFFNAKANQWVRAPPPKTSPEWRSIRPWSAQNNPFWKKSSIGYFGYKRYPRLPVESR